MTLRRASGLRAWALQRATALYLLFFTPFLLGKFLFYPPGDLAAWRDWVGGRWIGTGLLLYVLALLLHAWVGVRDVILDYVRPAPLRLLLLFLLLLFLSGCGLWAAAILFPAGRG